MGESLRDGFGSLSLLACVPAGVKPKQIIFYLFVELLYNKIESYLRIMANRRVGHVNFSFIPDSD